jgi:BirA family biotin operon repressor/biotin-[acetyl-CoA-carboxylase] ligase
MPSLSVTDLTREIVRPGGLWCEVQVAAVTGSTNADLLAQARSGAGEGLVLVAEAQTAGRGRMGRRWASPPGTGLEFSVLLRPAGVPAGLLGWLPLLAGLATATAVSGISAVATWVKWPNDVLAAGGKLAGILAESRGDMVVVGIGINVSAHPGGLPSPATSLAAETGHSPPRGRLLARVLGDLERWYLAWRDQPAPGDPDACGLRAAYRQRCATLGREVTVTLPDGRVLSGRASGVDRGGRLELITADGQVAVSAGDVLHVR